MQDAKSSQPEKKEPSTVVQPLVKKEEPKKAETKKVAVKAVKKSPSKAKKKKPTTTRKTTEQKVKAKVKTQKSEFNFMETIMTAKTYDFDKFTKDATAGSKELFDAMQKSMNIWAKGVEQINQEAIALTQEIANKNQEAFKALIACKDINELTDVQNKLAKKNFDAIVSASTKLSEISVKVATDSFAPINDQVNKAVKKATESVAA
ncbi:MAG: phasin family domain-containing protein [Alphaproteobacteria bacterium]|nr:phasin family domain-containing protein [Alphaproteobacteria bacterium]|tara:strand:+ start:1344 stop:1961 length:618 start_codon:yes stop_codon:yes gene_type:complete